MSFWNLVNGSGSDLVPPKDANPALQTAMGIAGAAAAVAAGIASALYSGSPVFAHVGLRSGSRALVDIPDRRDKILAQNLANAERRRELGRRYLEQVLANCNPSPELLCKVARARFAERCPHAALDAALQAVELDSDHAQANLLAIYYLLYLGRKNDALRLLEKKLTPSENEGFILHGIANLFRKSGDLDRAFDFVSFATSVNPKDSEGWAQQGAYHESQSNFAEAKKCYEKSAEYNSAFPLPWRVAHEQGQQALKEARLTDAEALFLHAERFDPTWADPIVGRALCATQKNEPERALTLLNRVLELQPTNAQAHLLKANIHHSREEADKAMDHWTKAFTYDPQLPVPWVVEFRKGKEYFEQHQWEEAISHFSSAAGWCEWPDLNFLLENAKRKLGAQRADQWGDYHYGCGREKSAESAWRESIALDDTVSNVYMKLGALLADRGDTSGAIELFSRALSLGHPLAQAALNLCRAYHDFCPETGPI